MSACVNGSRYLHGLIVNETLATIHEVLPLGAPPFDYFATTLHIFDSLPFAAFDQVTGLIHDFTSADSHVLCAVLCRCHKVFAGFTTALGSVQNADKGTKPETSEKPSKCLLIIGCHNAFPFHST